MQLVLAMILTACSPDGAISAYTRVFGALWRHPGTM